MTEQPVPQLSVSSAFAVPIAETVMPACDDLNRRLRELFLEWEKDPGRRRTSSPTGVAKVGVYESDFSLFSNPEAPVRTLRQFCLNTLAYTISSLNNYSIEAMRGLRIHEHSWYHVTRHAGYTAVHNHPMASWSGVYCVDPGDGADGKARGGALTFLDPRGAAGMYVDPGNEHLGRPFGFGALAYLLRSGQLLLFPSYLVHEVAPYFGQRERITVAFNAWVREAGQPANGPHVRAP